jgi:hypothetical protein
MIEFNIKFASLFTAIKRAVAGATVQVLEEEARAEERARIIAKQEEKNEKRRKAAEVEAAKKNERVGEQPHCPHALSI